MCTRAPVDTYTLTYKARQALEKAHVCYRKFLCTLRGGGMGACRAGNKASVSGRDPTAPLGSPAWQSCPCSGRAHVGWKCHISCKPTSKCLVLPGRQKSGIFTHSARSVKELGWGGAGVSCSICPFHLLGQSQFPCPLISAVSRLSASPCLSWPPLGCLFCHDSC